MKPVLQHRDSNDAVAIQSSSSLALLAEEEHGSVAVGHHRAQWGLAAVGLCLLGVLVYEAGPARLGGHLLALGGWAPIMFLPYAAAVAFDAAGWRATFEGSRPSLPLLYLVRLAGEAVNAVTPTAYLGGEPVKAYMLRRFGVPLTDGTTSVILAKTALTIAQIAFVILGVALLFATQGLTWSLVLALAALITTGAALTTLLVQWQRKGLVAFVARLARRLFPRARMVSRLNRHAAAIDAKLRAFYGMRPRAALAAVGLHLAGWLLGSVEVFAIMLLIGHPVTWSNAIVIEALAQPARLAGIVIPATLGVQEAGGMLIFALLGLAPELGLVLMLLKRLREMSFSLIGLALLARLRPLSH